MTDNEIVKALECCSKADCDNFCSDICPQCPYKNERYCAAEISKDALSLINRQKAETEKLQRRNKFLEIELRNSANLLSCRMSEEDTEEETPSVTADAAPPPSEREAYGRFQRGGGDDG